jgi:hypothetical protein
MKKNVVLLSLLLVALNLLNIRGGFAQQEIKSHKLTATIRQFEKAEFSISLSTAFENPYDYREIAVDMHIITPSARTLILPVYFESRDKNRSAWKARFTPQEQGNYEYHFVLIKKGNPVAETKSAKFKAEPSAGNGFLHIHDFWSFRFDSGKKFRGIGENIGWESRSFEDPKWTYDYLLPTLSSNGANFFRTWMCVWNLPLTWKKIRDTKRYNDSNGYFHEGGIRRMDELVELSDSLGLYIMLAFDWHGALMPEAEWKMHPYNINNGGTANSPTEFFTDEEAKAQYRNKLRYIVARWGYSTSIAAWEFFNEIDNAAFTRTPHDSVIIAHAHITQWHDEMSTFLKKIDPYQHIVTTSISHRDIEGMNDLPNIDLNQKHIYNRTHLLPRTLREYSKKHNKPYVIGEYGYDWNWDNVKHEAGPEFDYDYKRGLWYGLFNPTPIVPMTWWWEFFDERNMTPYFQNVRRIADAMQEAGDGNYEVTEVSGKDLDAYAVKCGAHYFVYLLNDKGLTTSPSITLTVSGDDSFLVKKYNPETRSYENGQSVRSLDGKVTLQEIMLAEGKDIIVILSPADSKTRLTTQGD